MSRKFAIFLSFIFIAAILNSNAAAQSGGDETFSVRSSKLSAINLPNGARQIKPNSVPQELRETLGKLVAAGGDKIKQGGSEVIVWEGNYKKAGGSQMIKTLEANLKNSGWEYEIGEQQSDFVLFSLLRTAPERRALIGFFVPSEDAFVFAITEMLRADAPVAAENQTEEPRVEEPNVNPRNPNKFNGGNKDLIGRWWRGTGSGSISATNQTQYKSGKDYTFEFFADGTVEYTYRLDVLSIIQCTVKEDWKQRGTYSVSGDTLTINLNAGRSVGSSSCEKKDNFNKTVPAEKIVKTFQIKPMDSVFRPDNPLTLCFAGQDGEACFEKSK